MPAQTPPNPAQTPPAPAAPSLRQRVGSALRDPEARATTARLAANVAGHAVDAMDISRKPGKLATAVGVGTFIDRASDELAPHVAGEPAEDSIRGWAAEKVDAITATAPEATEAPQEDGKPRNWLVRRLHSLRERITPQNIELAMGCATLILAGVKAGVDLAEAFGEGKDRSNTA